MSDAAMPDVGQEAPDFELKGPAGTPITLSEFRGVKNVMLVFYPLAFSPVCSHQIAELQAAFPRFKAADTEVFGISVDSHFVGSAFARTIGISFTLLSDWKREASAAYGSLIPELGFSARVSFLVDKQGKIIWREAGEYTGGVDSPPGVEGALAALAALGQS